MMVHGASSSVAHDFARTCGAFRDNLGAHRRRCLLRCGDAGFCKQSGCLYKIRGLRVCNVSLNLSVIFYPVFQQCCGVASPIRIFSQAGRRHHRRREPPGGLPGGRNADQRQRGDEKVEITLDFDEFKQKAGEAAVSTKNALASSVTRARQAGTSFIEDGKQAWKELRTSVAVRNDKRVVIAVKRSTIEFAGRTLIWTVLTVVFARLVLMCGRRFRWGWEESLGSPKIVRDRSLGGKEVVVRNGVKLWEGGPFKKAFRKTAQGLSPLDSVRVDTRSEKELHRMKANEDSSPFKTLKRASRLPAWWPAPEQAPKIPPETSAEAQKDATRLLNVMLEKRMGGIDFENHDICQLRHLCRNFGARVSFGTTSTRDSFYRTAIRIVLNACRSGLPLEAANEALTTFIAGLAGNIGLDTEKAATMVIAAVADRTKSTFIQTWSLHMIGSPKEVHKELQGLARILATFTPNPDSPEMELAAKRLTYFSMEERGELLQMYIMSGGKETESLAREALSLL